MFAFMSVHNEEERIMPLEFAVKFNKHSDMTRGIWKIT